MEVVDECDALFEAAANGDASTVARLLAAGAKPNGDLQLVRAVSGSCGGMQWGTALLLHS